jgi:hypothetical protein
VLESALRLAECSHKLLYTIVYSVNCRFLDILTIVVTIIIEQVVTSLQNVFAGKYNDFPLQLNRVHRFLHSFSSSPGFESTGQITKLSKGKDDMSSGHNSGGFSRLCKHFQYVQMRNNGSIHKEQAIQKEQVNVLVYH